MKTSSSRILASFIGIATVALLTSVVLANLEYFSGSPESGRGLRVEKSILLQEDEDLEENGNYSEWDKAKREYTSIFKSTPVRLHDHHIGIPVGAALEPPLCPPPPVTRSQGICFLTKCITNMDCPRGKACCFNGCVRTCTDPLDYPAAFDWVEDTSRILPILGPDFESASPDFMPILVPQHASGYAAAEGGEELVHLPGGCLVSASKHKKLKEFARASSIKECLCVDGEVLCEVIRIQSL